MNESSTVRLSSAALAKSSTATTRSATSLKEMLMPSRSYWEKARSTNWAPEPIEPNADGQPAEQLVEHRQRPGNAHEEIRTGKLFLPAVELRDVVGALA